MPLCLRRARAARRIPAARAAGRTPPLPEEKLLAANDANKLVLQPLELLRKLVALVLPPRVHLTRFHGVFAPNANARKRVVPEREEGETRCPAPPAADPVAVPPQEPHVLRPLPDEPRRNRVPWAALLRRSFAIEFPSQIRRPTHPDRRRWGRDVSIWPGGAEPPIAAGERGTTPGHVEAARGGPAGGPTRIACGGRPQPDESPPVPQALAPSPARRGH